MYEPHSAPPRVLAPYLFPDLVQELDAALDAHAQEDHPAAAFEQALAASVEALRASDVGSAILDEFGDAGRLAEVFACAEQIAREVGFEVPAPEAFLAAGVDADRLRIALSSDDTLTPVIAPAGLGANRWQSLYRTAARQPGSPIALADPLVLAEEVQHSFAMLDQPPRMSPTVISNGVTWSLRLVPATPAPTVLGLSHVHGPHVTLPEMLMLQLTRLMAGEEPVDQRSFTWLAGTLEDGRFAARHIFDAGERSVRVTSREVGNQGPHLGARPPIG